MSQRRLAAIMFTDIVGYTSLMGKDEDLAFNLLRKNLKLQKSKIRLHNGQFLKEIGDGILASFALASDAVRCAKAIQIASSLEGYQLTIGIHSGEMVFERADAWGDSVNVASRLQQFGHSGCILISGAVYQDIKNKPGFKVNFIEEKLLKNVDEPIKIYMVDYNDQQQSFENSIENKLSYKPLFYLIGGLVIVSIFLIILYFYPKNNSKNKLSFAVLYVQNISNKPEDQPLCDGLTQKIINSLSSISKFRVLPSESVFKYKSNPISSKKIASELEVNYILSVKWQKYDSISLISDLYDASDDKTSPLIVESSSDPKDILSFQNEIAQKVAASLNIFLSAEEEDLIWGNQGTGNNTLSDFENNNKSILNCSERIRFLLNWIHDPTFTGEYIALEKFWKQEGCEVQLLQGGVGKDPIELLESGRVDYAIVGADKALTAISNNIPIKIISVDQQRNPVGWIVRTSLEINSFKDLVGRDDIVLGDKSGTEISSILKLILERKKFDLNPQAVNFNLNYFVTNENVVYPVYLNEGPIQAKLKRNIDITEIDPSEKINGGIKLYGNVLIVHNDRFEKCFDQVENIITALNKGWEFANNNPDEAFKIVSNYVIDDENYVREVMNKSVEFSRNKYGEIVEPGDMNKNTWIKTINVLEEAGILSYPKNIDNSIYIK